jgi:hypothetical protein
MGCSNFAATFFFRGKSRHIQKKAPILCGVSPFFLVYLVQVSFCGRIALLYLTTQSVGHDLDQDRAEHVTATEGETTC